MSAPLAYLITWTTYGTWLPGDRRGWVEAGKPGIQAADSARESVVLSELRFSPVQLDVSQRTVVSETNRKHCDIRDWTLHALNVLTNHVHLVVTADDSPETVMSQLKAWCSRRLKEAEPCARQVARGKWWTEHGSTKWINDESYLQNAIHYVLEGQ